MGNQLVCICIYGLLLIVESKPCYKTRQATIIWQSKKGNVSPPRR